MKVVEKMCIFQRKTDHISITVRDKAKVSGGFRPGPGGGAQAPSFAPAPGFVATHDFFGKDNTNFFYVFAFPNFRKAAKFAASIERPKAKSASASWRLCPPDPLTRGSAPEPCWGLCPQTPL